MEKEIIYKQDLSILGKDKDVKFCGELKYNLNDDEFELQDTLWFTLEQAKEFSGKLSNFIKAVEKDINKK